MGILHLIFSILSRWVDFPEGKESELKDEAFNWKNKMKEKLKVMKNEELSEKELSKLDKKDQLLYKLLYYNEQWYVQLLMAIMFLPLNRMIAEYIGETMRIANNEVSEDLE